MAKLEFGTRTSHWDTFFVGLAICVWSSLAKGETSFSDFRFATEPSDKVIQRDRQATLECAAHISQGTAEVQWIKDDLPLANNPRRNKLPNGTLYFDRVEFARTSGGDEGEYQCKIAAPGIGTLISRKATVQVAYLDRVFLEEPTDTLVHLNDNVMLPCSIAGSPRPSITWYKNEEIINPDRSPNKIIHDDGVLEINGMSFADFESYRCEARNIERSKSSQEITISQNSDVSAYERIPPHFIMRPRDRVAEEGSSVMLYCGANGRDRHEEVPTISWLKDGSTIEFTEDGRFSIVGQGSLRIDSIQAVDAGSYTCRAANQEDSVDADLTLTVHVPPRFLRRPRNNTVQVNSDTELECDVSGTPRPTITWLKNGEPVINSGYFQVMDGRNLQILGLIESDTGLYQCFAENTAGSIQASAQLVVEHAVQATSDTPLTNPHSTGAPDVPPSPNQLPSPPTHLMARVVSERFVTLAWRMPERMGGSEIESYSIYWREAGSTRERVQNTDSMEANIQHLKPGTVYDFRVLAHNRAGVSSGATLQIQTPQEVKVPGKPVNLVASAIDPTAIKITWGPPTPANGHIDHYKLHYYQVGAQRQFEREAPTTSYTLTGLNKFTEYSIRVVAHNGNGAGISTEEVTCTTFSDVPSAPPQNVTLETMSSTSIIVRWEPPPEDEQNGLITGYKIRYRRRNQRGSDIITTDATRRTFPVTELERETEYQIRMQALTVNGSGPATEWHIAQTYAHDLDETSVPGQPSSLQVRPLADSIVVSWTPPEAQDIMIRGYILGFGIGVPDTYQQILEANDRFHTIKNLQPATQYIISVRAKNNAGPGRPILEEVTTREEPETERITPMLPPVGLKADVLSPTTILITWSDSTLGRNQRVPDSRVYTIRYSTTSHRKYKFVNATDLNFHFRDLRPNTEYEFSVKVIKGSRRSSWSLSAYNVTFETAPTSAPRSVTPAKVEGHPDKVQLSWQPPRMANGQISGYTIYYTVKPEPVERDWVRKGTLGDQLSLIIEDLTFETKYFFKVRAENNKGLGPVSKTVIFETPAEDGTGGGMVDIPEDYPPYPGDTRGGDGEIPGLNQPDRGGQSEGGIETEEEEEGFPKLVLWVSIGCIGGLAVLAAVVIVFLCRKRQQEANRRPRGGAAYKKAPVKPGPKDLKPPDLWIHDQMELKGMEKGDGSEMVSPMPHTDSDGKSTDDHMHSEKNYDPRDDERYSRTPLRPKPIMIPVDQPPPPRELPNGHLGLMGEGSAPPLMRPIYPRTQCSSQFSSTPRVNAGDMSQHSSEEQNTSSTLERRKAKDRLKKNAANNPRMTVRPQQQQQKQSSSPHKKASSRAPMAAMNANQAPDVTVPAGKEGDAAEKPLQKSYSTEELTAEMANLEGLMKDLNAITQQEFEC